MSKFIKLFLIAFFVFLAIDAVWLVLIAKDFYAAQLGFIMTPEVNFVAAFVFYVLFIIGNIVLVVKPALEKKSWKMALLNGALLGLVSYATYDLTNLATLKDWPILVTVVDLIWGTFVASAVSVITYKIAERIKLHY